MKFRDKQKRKVTPNPDLTPMIDVVFQLLIFFMLSSTFVVQSTIKIEMPEAKATTTLDKKDLTITLAYGEGGPEGKGPVYVDNIEMQSMEELFRLLSDKLAAQPDIMVLFHADARINTGRLVEAMGIASSVGVRRFGIGAEISGE